MLRGLIFIFMSLGSFYLFSQDTELKFYRPYADPDQHGPIVIKKQMAGECWQQSHYTKRADAWRCRGRGRIYDPCFVKLITLDSSALCPLSPWDGDSILLNLQEPIDSSHHLSLDMSSAHPWALELISGEKCQAVEEKGGEDVKIRYHCNNQSILLGKIHRCKASWSILQQKGEALSTVKIIKAWF